MHHILQRYHVLVVLWRQFVRSQQSKNCMYFLKNVNWSRNICLQHIRLALICFESERFLSSLLRSTDRSASWKTSLSLNKLQFGSCTFYFLCKTFVNSKCWRFGNSLIGLHMRKRLKFQHLRFGTNKLGASGNRKRQESSGFDRPGINEYHVDNKWRKRSSEGLPANLLIYVMTKGLEMNSKNSFLTFQGTDQSMLNNLHIHHESKEGLYFRPQSDLDKSFGIAHYAGTVFYHSKGFLIFYAICYS